MKTFRKPVLAALCLLLWGGALSAQPRLVVGIVVDQMRWDYLRRYAPRYTEGGFRRMMREGYENTQCHINYLPSITAVGHAALYTGTVPAYTGITGNSFWLNGRRTYCVADSTVEGLGSTSAGARMSPRNLLPTTMTDQLRLATNFQGKSIGIALKDRAAILPAGHAANAAYWMVDNRFVSSTYYMKELPQWVVDFNARNLPDQYMQRGWPEKLMYPDHTYTQSHPRDPRIEHSVGDRISTTPWGATYTLEMARAAIEGEQLGQDETVDFLAVSISSTDAIAHRTGCNSPFIEDAYLWLDRDLEQFFRYLDKQVGKGRWTAFLSADHAGQHAPQFRADHRLPAPVVEVGRLKPALDSLLAVRIGQPGPYVLGISSWRVALDEAALDRAGLPLGEAISLLCAELERHPLITHAFDPRNIPSHLPAPLPEMVRNGYHPKRSGHIQLIPEPGVMEPYRYGEGQNMKGASHALWTPDDTHLPCLFMGWGVPRGVRDTRPARIVDIAATVCSLLGIQSPNACVGQPLF